jgi:CRISPR-associated exonuclease Cas4
MAYSEEDYLQLSGIQHFLYCRRQWALIDIEQQWKENVRTVEGKLLHKKAHDPESRELRGNRLTVRGMKIHSPSLGLSGECDVVEFYRKEDGVKIFGMEGLWMPYPVEYKRGEPKEESFDEAQLCAQAISLEEMLCCDINEGALYYGENRRRHEVMFTQDLRELVYETAREMHKLYIRGDTPMVKRKKGCNACSLKDICLPKIQKNMSVVSYLDQIIRGE